jgi:N-acetylglucosaminyldiphosphoundecaprenol N-acetyl-beta-D-mannosaminyltransferase
LPVRSPPSFASGTPTRAVPASARHSVLGVDCFVGDLDTAASAVVDRAGSGQGGYAVLCNTHVLTQSQHSAAVRQALEEAWLVFADGAPVAWLQRRTGADGARRIAGPDLMPVVLAKGREVGMRHFLFGSTPAVLGLLESRLEQAFSGVEIVGARAPEPGAEHLPEALASIRSARPDVVWVALGAPRQELWMHRHADELQPSIALGVGAAFDFHGGTKPRAPKWLQNAGLEWLHRLFSEPARLAPRYVRANTEFMLLAGRELFARRRTA